MNAPSKIETGTMTSKGQILIPKAMRDAAGLVPGQPYKVTVNGEGQVVVTPLGFSLEEASERRSEEHTSELQSLMRISYAVFCLKKKNEINTIATPKTTPNTVYNL